MTWSLNQGTSLLFTSCVRKAASDVFDGWRWPLTLSKFNYDSLLERKRESICVLVVQKHSLLKFALETGRKAREREREPTVKKNEFLGETDLRVKPTPNSQPKHSRQVYALEKKGMWMKWDLSSTKACVSTDHRTHFHKMSRVSWLVPSIF